MSIYQYSLSSIGWSFFFLSTLRRTAHCLNPWQGWNERSEIMPSAVSTIPFQRYRGGQVTNEGGKMQFNILLLYYIDYRCIHIIHIHLYTYIWYIYGFQGCQLPLNLEPVAAISGAGASSWIPDDPRPAMRTSTPPQTTSWVELGRRMAQCVPLKHVETLATLAAQSFIFMEKWRFLCQSVTYNLSN